jgi:O-acetylhomoserine/O-acetylserine sulfhydrylase-like pyridoxal-dependent enzyme
MAAITAMCTMMKTGDHVVCSDNVYGGTGRLFDYVMVNYGLTFTYVDTSVAENVAAAITPATKSDDVDYGYSGGGGDMPCAGCGTECR